MRVYARPRDLIHYETTRLDRLRSDATYTYRHLKGSLRSIRQA
jgi:hypothetical protein